MTEADGSQQVREVCWNALIGRVNGTHEGKHELCDSL